MKFVEECPSITARALGIYNTLINMIFYPISNLSHPHGNAEDIQTGMSPTHSMTHAGSIHHYYRCKWCLRQCP